MRSMIFGASCGDLGIVKRLPEFDERRASHSYGRCLTEWARWECRSAGSLDLRLEFCEHRRSPFHAQHVPCGMVHVLVTRLSIDGKQLRHLRHDSCRGNVLLIELGRLHKASS